ncbi:uncharacterized protein cubi_01107 [Cryptosporidium ubiquitum]|uniref:KNTC1 third ARM-repeats domain-containing protein n=1 Tax=Cryptosporidium ubiquitum TaxID=857276 RepID=A0A1J4MJR9_9CRYT|nr:uncharacterized protein cubi_01107 [Cryptosporidium ubiquitum]OII74263.1 hypothetical protein cubi_01107 [Cryptosporidium ubiquitum]
MYLKKVIELGKLPNLSLPKDTNGVRKVTISNDRICIIVENWLFFYILTKNHESARLIYSWKINSKEELILDGLWIDSGLFITLSSSSIYLFTLEDELITEVKTAKHDCLKTIRNSEIVLISSFSKGSIGSRIIIAAVNFSSGFFLFSIEYFESEYFIDIGNIVTTQYKGAIIPCDNGMVFVNSSFINKFYIGQNIFECKMIDSLYIKEILNRFIGEHDFKLISKYKTVKDNMLNIVFLMIEDNVKFNGIEITISSTKLIPIKMNKISIKNPENIINISHTNILNNISVNILTYESNLMIYEASLTSSKTCLAYYNDLNESFIPFVSQTQCENSIFYAGCTLEKKTGKIFVNILEKESDYNLIKNEVQKFESYNTMANEQITLNIDELNNQFDGIIPLNMIISKFKKLISNLEKVDYNYILDYAEKVPLFNIEDTLNLYSSLVSALEASNSSNVYIMKINYLIQKSLTFDIIYKNNDRNFEVALKICSEYDSNLSEIDTNWNNLLKKFFKCDLGKLCNCLLSLNLIEEFFFLFNRHFIHFGNGDEAIRSEIILELLNNLPINLPEQIEKEIPSWLINQVFPYVIDKDKLLKWIADRAVALEHISNGDIDRCLFFLSSVFLNEYSNANNQILPKQIVSNGILWAGSGNKRNSIYKMPSNKINQVYWAFLECNDLKNRYKLEIEFSSLYYKKITTKDIAFKLLSRISSSELLNYEINHHVIPFCKSRGLEADQIIMEYLLDLISSINYNSLEKKNNITNNRTYYQPRIISLINSITDEEYKAYALLQYLSLNNKCHSMNNEINLKFPHSVQNEMDYLISYARNLSVDGKRSFELKNRIALIDAQNLLSRYNLDGMASIILFEKNAPRRLILHVISQVDAGIESFNDAVFLIDYLKHETNTTFMGISEAYCLRLRFIIFRRRNIVGWEKMTKKSITGIQNKIIEEEILDIFSIIGCKKKIYNITQQFVCFIWQFLDCYSMNCNKSHKLRIKCEIATYSAIVVLREFFKLVQENNWKIKQKTFWVSNESFNTFIRLQQLQFEFGMFLRPSDIMLDKMDHDQDYLFEKESQTKNTYLEPFQKNTFANPFGKIETKFYNNPIFNESFIFEWKNGYFQLYKESCYKKLCEIFDKFAQPLFEVKNFNEQKKGIFTKLLRLGSLIGVDESYVRRTMIRHSIRDGGKMCIFKRLTQELYKTPSSKNAMTIIDEVQNIILNLLTSNSINKNKSTTDNEKGTCIHGPELIFIFSKLLQVVAACIPYYPVKLISFVLALSSDILWAHDFLVHASDATDHFENSNDLLINDYKDDHLFSKLIINSLKNIHYIPLDSNKSYYKEICTLYPFVDAKQVAMTFLSCKIRISKELSKQVSVKKTYISPFVIYNFWTDPTLWTIQSDENYNIDAAKYIQELRENVDILVKKLYQSECLSLAMSIYLKHPFLISDMKLVLNINIEFFRKVLKGRDPMDGQLCMALSSSLEKKDSWNVFVQSLNPLNILDNYYRAQRMARIGWDLGILFNHYSMRKEMEDLHKQSKWCNSFIKLKIDFDQSLFFQKQDPQNTNQEYKKSIICKLIHNSDFDLILCLQYAKDYNINDEYVLFLWSKLMILYYFDPKFELKMQNILSFVTPELVKEIFENTFELISSFDYERLIFVLNWYNQNCIDAIARSNSKNIYCKTEANKDYSSSTSSSYNERNNEFKKNQSSSIISTISNLEVLKILSTHKRICSADDDEKQFIKYEFERIDGSTESLVNKINKRIESQISYRIPFHYLIKYPINALKYEINDETIYKIKKMSQYLGIPMIFIDIQFVWNIVLCRRYKFLAKNDLVKDKLKNFQEYCSKLVESDKILLRYIESIASFDLESGIAIVLLVIDELPLSNTKIKLIEWCESKSGKVTQVELKKGYPIVNMEYLVYSRHDEIVMNINSYLKSKKSLISSILILKKHGLDLIFSKLIEETNDINILISSLYYYLTPLISEGIYWKFKSELQETVSQSFCMHFESERDTCNSKIKLSSKRSADFFSNFNLIENFNLFVEEISNIYSSDIKKIRMRIIKNLLSKPFETPYEATKNKFPVNLKEIFAEIENSGIIAGLDHWYGRKQFSSKFFDCTYIDRVSFVCRGISLNDAILLLLSISFKDSASYTYLTKCNALRTLFQIASIKSIQKRYPKYDDLKVIWLHNYYMIYFNDLYIPQDFSKFYLSEKAGLARSLWREYNNRRNSYEFLKSSQKRFDRIENTEEIEFLIDDNRKKKVRCLSDKENEYSNNLEISLNGQYKNLDTKLSNILYLIAKLCVDFEIFDPILFSNTIHNLYLQLLDEKDVKIFSDLIFATYNSGYIYKIKIDKSIIDVWNILIFDPILSLKNTVEYVSNLVRKYGQNSKDMKECVYKTNLLYNLPNKRYMIPLLSKIYNICPITPFIEIIKLLNALIELINSILNLKEEIIFNENLNTDIKKEDYQKLISHIISLFLTLVKDISENNKINSIEKRYKMLSLTRDNLSIYEISSIFNITVIELLFSYVNPVDLHYTLFSTNREKIIKVIIDQNNFKLLPYIIYSTSSNMLISALSLELIKTDNTRLFFEISILFKELFHYKKLSQIEELYLIESIKAKKVYEFIICKYGEVYNTESIQIIRRCIEFYKIETVIPLIIKFLSGEVRSESTIIDQINRLEKQRTNDHELSKLEIYSYIKDVIIKLNKKYKSTNIVQELIEQFKS